MNSCKIEYAVKRRCTNKKVALTAHIIKTISIGMLCYCYVYHVGLVGAT